jgi:SAM-dependent methyltransferase
MRIPRQLIPASVLPTLRKAKKSLVTTGESFLYFLNKWIEPRNVNLGGGLFIALGWKNLEAVQSHINPQPFIFSPACVFPFSDASINLVYSSHALEHMDPETVNRIFEESYRILKPSGKLILKLPDFDQTLECWKNEDADFFGDQWGFEDLVSTWRNRNLTDNLDNRAMCIFCGFWNQAYGNHFEKIWSRPTDTNAEIPNTESYHGPPVVSSDVLQELKSSNSPNKIANILRNTIIKTEHDYSFNHQNAWGRNELKELISQFGFVNVSTDSKTILSEYSHIPKIREMLSISMYLQANKPI